MKDISIDIQGSKTDLYPITFQNVKELDKIISDKLMAWRVFPARWKLHITDYYGKVIHYDEVHGYEGSPEIVFWDNFIEPFLENGIIDILKTTYQMCKEKNLDPIPYMKETCESLKLLNRKTYENMSRTDQLLRGKGYPNSVTPKKVDEKINKINQFIDSYFTAILKRGKEHKDSSTEDIIDIKPNFCGIGLNFNALWKKAKKYLTIRWT